MDPPPHPRSQGINSRGQGPNLHFHPTGIPVSGGCENPKMLHGFSSGMIDIELLGMIHIELHGIIDTNWDIHSSVYFPHTCRPFFHNFPKLPGLETSHL